MPLLRITSPPDRTDELVRLLATHAGARELSVEGRASRLGDGDLIVADVPRSAVDGLLSRLAALGRVEGLRVSVQDSEQLYPRHDGDRGEPDGGVDDVADDEAVVWAQVGHDIHEAGRLSWINVLLVVIAAAIAAVGIMEDQLLLIVGAMALSPDYYPVADTCLAFVRRNRSQVGAGMATLAISFSAAAVGAFVLAEVLGALDIVTVATAPAQEFTLFISEPDPLSVVVAVLAGIAGALAITLPGTRGIVGVFVSITTIPAAANIGVALAARDWSEMAGAAVQLGVNIASLLVAGTITLELRHRLS